jgi:hypothetical protein
MADGSIRSPGPHCVALGRSLHAVGGLDIRDGMSACGPGMVRQGAIGRRPRPCPVRRGRGAGGDPLSRARQRPPRPEPGGGHPGGGWSPAAEPGADEGSRPAARRGHLVPSGHPSPRMRSACLPSRHPGGAARRRLAGCGPMLRPTGDHHRKRVCRRLLQHLHRRVDGRFVPYYGSDHGTPIDDRPIVNDVPLLPPLGR